MPDIEMICLHPEIELNLLNLKLHFCFLRLSQTEGFNALEAVFHILFLEVSIDFKWALKISQSMFSATAFNDENCKILVYLVFPWDNILTP